MELKEQIKSIIKQTTILFGGNALELPLRYLYSIMLARFLGVELTGIYFLGLSVINFIAITGRFEMQDAVLRFVSSYEGALDKARSKGVVLSAARIVLMFGALTAAAVFFLSGTISETVFKQPLLKKALIGFAVSIPFTGLLSMSVSYFQARLKMKYSVMVQSIAQPLAGMAVLLLVCSSGAKLYGAVFAYVASILISFVIAVYFASRLALFDNKVVPVNQAAQLLKFSLPLVFASMLHFAIQWMDTFIVGYFRSAHELGIYSIAVRTASLCTVFLVPFNMVFSPFISDLCSKNMVSSLANLYKLLTKWLVTLTLPLFLFIALYAADILALFGPGFSAGREALLVLAFGQIFNVVASSVYQIILMSGRSRTVLVNSICVCLLNLALNLFMIPRYGFRGAAIANTATIIIFNLIMMAEVYIFMRIHPYSLNFLKPITAAAISILVSGVLKYPFSFMAGPVPIMFNAALMCVCYAACLYLLRFDKEDMAVLGMFRNKLFGKAAVKAGI